MGAVRLAIVDDHQMVLQGLHTWIEDADKDLSVVIRATNWTDLLAHEAFPVDVVLLDLDLRDGVPAAVKIAMLRSADVPVVIISTLADAARVRECIAAGASGYLPKSEPAEEIVRAVRAAAGGESYVTASLAALLVDSDVAASPSLSPQERRALVLYATGLPMKSVARRMDISVDTAKCYVDRVREKYAQAGREARTKIDLHRRALEDGLLPDG
jgi:DNA-binding NarL/FixJ family response regulator